MVFKTNLIVAILIILNGCSPKTDTITITVENTLGIERTFETVELTKDFLNLDDLSTIGLQDSSNNQIMLSQTIDNDGDGIKDVILFQPQIASYSQKDFNIVTIKESDKPKGELLCYSRFVPERTDDYAWENDKVAFRTFGPTAQKMFEENIPGGTLSSGIDLWLKKVNYSIIDKWYAGNLEEKGYYHKDHGEGYDPYHVGISRGTGGIGVWKGERLLTSKNFVSYNTIAVGPLRTVFELEYQPWSEYSVKETKRISLDLGSNFSKFDIKLTPDTPVPNYAIGITLHDGKGDVVINKQNGFYAHWEKINKSFLGEAIIIESNKVQRAFDFRTSVPDQSQLLVLTDPSHRSLTYYAGFAWTESGDVSTKEDWIQMLVLQVQKINNPLKVTLKNQ